MSSPLRGVNLGGWLVLEPWITPGLFEGSEAVDEYTYCQLHAEDLSALTKHRDSFITEQDFAWLQAHGIEAVRLPVGYWLFGDEAPYAATVKYVDKAFTWAKKHKIKILLDLHGAPSSQNGKIHSGRQGAIEWDAHKTLDVLIRLAEQYGQYQALLGISLLNEPSPEIGKSALKDFYVQAYHELRSRCAKDAWIIFSDAFRPRWWRREFEQGVFPAMSLDYHHYQIYRWMDKLLPVRWQLWRTSFTVPHKIRRMAKHHPVIIGEWSLALRTGKRVTPAQRQQYAQRQLAAFSSAQAWFFWNYRTGYGSSWSYRECVDESLIA
jgi:glucan 1,3-beta-glucosidase